MRIAYEILVGLILFIVDFIKGLFKNTKGILILPFKQKDNPFLTQVTEMNLFILIPVSLLSFYLAGQIHLIFGAIASMVVPLLLATFAESKTSSSFSGDAMFGYIVFVLFVSLIFGIYTQQTMVPKYQKIGEITLKEVPKSKIIQFGYNGHMEKVHLSDNDKVGDEVSVYEETEDTFWYVTSSRFYTFKPNEVPEIKSEE